MTSSDNNFPQRRIEEQYIRELRERARLQRQRTLLITAMAAVLALLGLTVSIVGVTAFEPVDKTQLLDPLGNAQSIRNLTNELKGLKNDLAVTKSAMGGIQTSMPESEIAVKQAEFTSQIASLGERQHLLEAALQETPEKALSIPLLRKDLAELDRRTIEYRSISQSEAERLYSQQIWIIGGMGTTLLAVAGGAITIFFKSLSKPNEKSDPSTLS